MRGAEVRVRGEAYEKKISTDSEEHFIVTDVPRKKISVTVTGEGFATTERVVTFDERGEP